MLRLNKNGLTLVEIIATVTILGILSVVGIVSVNSIIQRGKVEHYNTIEKNIRLTAESYAQANRSSLPKNIGETSKITLRTLVEDNYIEDVKDYYDKNCDLDGSYVQIFKYSKTEYSYLTYLNCPDYTNEEVVQSMKPDIEINMTPDSNNVKKTEAVVKINDESKLLSYSITVYKYNEQVYTTGNQDASYSKEISKTVDISKYTPGKIKVVVKGTNIYGQTATLTKTTDYADRQGPACVIQDVDKETNPKPWTQTAKTITVGCDDGDGAGCAKDEFTKTFKTTTVVGKIVIEDKAGNKTTCNVSVNVDTTAPSCNVSFSGTKGDNDWYKTSPVTVRVNPTDSHSGVATQDITTSSTATYSGTTTATQSDTAGITWYGYVKDNVGNVASCSNSVKVDTTVPTCTVSLSGTSGNNGWYKSNVNLTLNPSDALSGVAKTGLSTSSTPTLGSTKTGTQSDVSGIVWYGRVQDNAGNIGSCSSVSFKVDTTKPSISWDTSAGPHNNSSGITVYTTCIDSMSGVASHTRSSSVGSPTTGTSKTHTCTDNAGNSSSTSRTFQVKTYGRDSDCGVERYNSCRTSACGVESYKSCATSACGAKTCTTSACGVSSYKSCESSSCGVKTYTWHCCNNLAGSYCTTYTGLSNPYPNGYCGKTGTIYNTCRTSACGVASYKTCASSACGYYSCRTSACGVESYYSCRTSACGVELYNQCWHY